MSSTTPDQKPGSPPPAAMLPGPAAAGAEPDPLTRDSAPVSDLETRFSRAALADSETARQLPQLPNALVGVGAMTEAEALRREMQRMDADLRVMAARDQALLRGVGEFRRLQGEVGGLKVSGWGGAIPAVGGALGCGGGLGVVLARVVAWGSC